MKRRHEPLSRLRGAPTVAEQTIVYFRAKRITLQEWIAVAMKRRHEPLSRLRGAPTVVEQTIL